MSLPPLSTFILVSKLEGSHWETPQGRERGSYVSEGYEVNFIERIRCLSWRRGCLWSHWRETHSKEESWVRKKRSLHKKVFEKEQNLCLGKEETMWARFYLEIGNSREDQWKEDSQICWRELGEGGVKPLTCCGNK